jgi:hypothetical protein
VPSDDVPSDDDESLVALAPPPLLPQPTPTSAATARSAHSRFNEANEDPPDRSTTANVVLARASP